MSPLSQDVQSVESTANSNTDTIITNTPSFSKKNPESDSKSGLGSAGTFCSDTSFDDYSHDTSINSTCSTPTSSLTTFERSNGSSEPGHSSSSPLVNGKGEQSLQPQVLDLTSSSASPSSELSSSTSTLLNPLNYNKVLGEGAREKDITKNIQSSSSNDTFNSSIDASSDNSHSKGSTYHLQLRLLDSFPYSVKYQIDQLVTRFDTNLATLSSDLETLQQNITNLINLSSTNNPSHVENVSRGVPSDLVLTNRLESGQGLHALKDESFNQPQLLHSTLDSLSPEKATPVANTTNTISDTTTTGTKIINVNSSKNDNNINENKQTSNVELQRQQKDLQLLIAKFDQKMRLMETSLHENFVEIYTKVSDSSKLVEYIKKTDDNDDHAKEELAVSNTKAGSEGSDVNCSQYEKRSSQAVGLLENGQEGLDNTDLNAEKCESTETQPPNTSNDDLAFQYATPDKKPKQETVPQDAPKSPDKPVKKLADAQSQQLRLQRLSRRVATLISRNSTGNIPRRGNLNQGGVNKPWWTEELSYLKQEATWARGLVKIFSNSNSKDTQDDGADDNGDKHDEYVARAKSAINKYHRAIKAERNKFCKLIGTQAVTNSSGELNASLFSGNSAGVFENPMQQQQSLMPNYSNGSVLWSTAANPGNLRVQNHQYPYNSHRNHHSYNGKANSNKYKYKKVHKSQNTIENEKEILDLGSEVKEKPCEDVSVESEKDKGENAKNTSGTIKDTKSIDEPNKSTNVNSSINAAVSPDSCTLLKQISELNAQIYQLTLLNQQYQQQQMGVVDPYFETTFSYVNQIHRSPDVLKPCYHNNHHSKNNFYNNNSYRRNNNNNKNRFKNDTYRTNKKKSSDGERTQTGGKKSERNKEV